jgi:hypothetical protein
MPASRVNTLASGKTWLEGTGNPDPNNGNMNNYYLDKSNGNVFLKTAPTTWTLVGNMSPAEISGKWSSGSGAPDGSIGIIGDFYLDTDGGLVYEKTGETTWTLRADLTPPPAIGIWTAADGLPTAGLGSVGDFYLDRTTGKVYEKTGETAWTERGDITTPTPSGVWRSSAGIPVMGEGIIGDYHLDTSTGDFYEKTGELEWTWRGNVYPRAGAWFSGSGAPSTSAGVVGDFYLDLTAQTVYEKTGETTWTVRQITPTVTGIWHVGTAAPSGSLGQVGDFYLNSTTGDVYEKTGASTWTVRGDLSPTIVGVWHTGSGAPSTSLGSVNDFYLNTSTGEVYEKIIGTVLGPTYSSGITAQIYRPDYVFSIGETITLAIAPLSYSGAGIGGVFSAVVQAIDMGGNNATLNNFKLTGGSGYVAGETLQLGQLDGSLNFRLVYDSVSYAAVVFTLGNVSGETWTLRGDLTQAAPTGVWLSGTLSPSSGLGNPGDFYLRVTDGYVWQKTNLSTWELRGDLTTPAPSMYTSNLAVRAVSEWTSKNAAAENSWQSVCWSPELGLFCAVASSGTGSRVMTSPDGINWTIRVSAADNPWMSVCWSPEKRLFCAVAYSGTARVMTSPDGITWTAQSGILARNWYSVCWAPELGKFCAIGYLWSFPDAVATSPDGVTWTPQNNADAYSYWRGVCWSPELNLFCAVATNTGSGMFVVMTSPDGVTWTGRNIGTLRDLYSVCWSKKLGLFCAVGYSVSGYSILTSPDGINWTQIQAPANVIWYSVVWSDELEIFVAINYSQAGQRVMTSQDGLSWTLRSTPADNTWQGLSWSPELGIFCAVSSSGTNNRVMISRYVGANKPQAYFRKIPAGGSSGQVLSTDSKGNLSWTTPASALVTFGTYDGSTRVAGKVYRPHFGGIVSDAPVYLGIAGGVGANGTGADELFAIVNHDFNNNGGSLWFRAGTGVYRAGVGRSGDNAIASAASLISGSDVVSKFGAGRGPSLNTTTQAVLAWMTSTGDFKLGWYEQFVITFTAATAQSINTAYRVHADGSQGVGYGTAIGGSFIDTSGYLKFYVRNNATGSFATNGTDSPNSQENYGFVIGNKTVVTCFNYAGSTCYAKVYDYTGSSVSLLHNIAVCESGSNIFAIMERHGDMIFIACRWFTGSSYVLRIVIIDANNAVVIKSSEYTITTPNNTVKPTFVWMHDGFAYCYVSDIGNFITKHIYFDGRSVRVGATASRAISGPIEFGRCYNHCPFVTFLPQWYVSGSALYVRFATMGPACLMWSGSGDDYYASLPIVPLGSGNSFTFDFSFSSFPQSLYIGSTKTILLNRSDSSW